MRSTVKVALPAGGGQRPGVLMSIQSRHADTHDSAEPPGSKWSVTAGLAWSHRKRARLSRETWNRFESSRQAAAHRLSFSKPTVTIQARTQAASLLPLFSRIIF